MSVQIRVSQLDQLTGIGGVLRYHTHHAAMLREQTTGQHAYNVAMIILWLFEGDPPPRLLIAALLHDGGERWTGDMPAPVKHTLAAYVSVDDMEEAALREHTGLSMPSTGEFASQISPSEEQLLRAADRLEGLIHCYREASLGNQAHRALYTNYKHYLANLLMKIGKDIKHAVPQDKLELLWGAYYFFSSLEGKMRHSSTALTGDSE